MKANGGVQISPKGLSYIYIYIYKVNGYGFGYCSPIQHVGIPNLFHKKHIFMHGGYSIVLDYQSA